MMKAEFSNKYEFEFAKDRGYGKPLGIVHSSGESWNTLRKFTVTSLKSVGFGNQTIVDEIMCTEIKSLLSDIGRKAQASNGIVLMDNVFGISAVNILWNFVAGKRLSSSTEIAERLIQLNKTYAQSVSLDRVSVLFPSLRRLLTNVSGFRGESAAIKDLQDFMKGIIKARTEVKKSRNTFVDIFLAEIEKHEDSLFTEEQLIVILMDLFIGGSETTSNALSFAILFMVLNLEVQRKVQQEIDHICKNAFPSYNDLKRMPYTQATILEIFRMALIIPVPFGRVGRTDSYINGFFIPKGTCIVYNLNSIQMDKAFWKDPNVFRPERFLYLGTTELLMKRVPLFGFRRRICPGDKFAKVTFFAFFTSFLQKYEFLPVPGESLSTEPRPSANAQAPYPFTAFIKSRPYSTVRLN